MLMSHCIKMIYHFLRRHFTIMVIQGIESFQEETTVN